MLRRRAMNERRQPYGDVRKLALLSREKIARQRRLLSETYQLLRDSYHLISRTQELIRDTQHLNRYNDDPEDRTD
jgi:hypothetical protein